jgi:hypothetical protein
MPPRSTCIIQPEANSLLTSTLASDDPIDSDPLLTMPPSVLGVCLGNMNTDCGLMAINLCLAMVAKSANLNPGLNVLRSLVNYRYDGQGLLAFSMRMRDLSIALQSAFHYPGGGTSGVHPLATPPVVIDLIMKSLQEAFFDHSDTVRAEWLPATRVLVANFSSVGSRTWLSFHAALVSLHDDGIFVAYNRAPDTTDGTAMAIRSTGHGGGGGKGGGGGGKGGGGGVPVGKGGGGSPWGAGGGRIGGHGDPEDGPLALSLHSYRELVAQVKRALSAHSPPIPPTLIFEKVLVSSFGGTTKIDRLRGKLTPSGESTFAEGITKFVEETAFAARTSHVWGKFLMRPHLRLALPTFGEVL